MSLGRNQPWEPIMKVKVATVEEMRKIRLDSAKKAATMNEEELEEDLKSKGFTKNQQDGSLKVR